MTITNGEPVWKLILTCRAGNKYNLNLLIINWRAKRARNFFLDFDVSNQPVSEFGLHYWRQIIFFTVPLSKFIFFSQNQSKDFFFRNIPAPPLEYQMDRALIYQNHPDACLHSQDEKRPLNWLKGDLKVA